MPLLRHTYQRGEFFQMLSGGFQPTLDDLLSDRSYFGLPPAATFTYGRLDAEDGEMFEIARRVSRNTSQTSSDIGGPPQLLLFQSTLIDGERLRYDLPHMKEAALTNGCVAVREGDEIVWRSAVPEGKPFEMRMGENTFSWVEDGLFELKGTPVRPGLHWYLPGRDYGTYYVSQFVEVGGTVLGRPVRGIIAFDQNYMGEEGALYVNKDLILENQAHLVWCTWATRYADGSFEGGHFMVGHDRLGFGVITDGKTVRATQNVDARVYPQEDSVFADRIVLTVDGELWEFLRDPKGAMPDMLAKHPPTPQQEGRWRRVGDTREPSTWFAWGETEPHHGSFRGDPIARSPLA